MNERIKWVHGTRPGADTWSRTKRERFDSTVARQGLNFLDWVRFQPVTFILQWPWPLSSSVAGQAEHCQLIRFATLQSWTFVRVSEVLVYWSKLKETNERKTPSYFQKLETAVFSRYYTVLKKLPCLSKKNSRMLSVESEWIGNRIQNCYLQKLNRWKIEYKTAIYKNWVDRK